MRMIEPYYSTTDPDFLGRPNLAAARGNPLKGLVGGIRWAPPPLPQNIPLSLEFFNVGLKEVMIGDNVFDWTIIEDLLQGSSNRHNHVVVSSYIHWPGRELQLPDFLVGLVKMIPTHDESIGPSPDYGDPHLLCAMEQFIRALAQRFDGDTRIAAIHVGLLGFWGEFHTYPFENILPDSSKEAVINWYGDSFCTTKIQARYPRSNTCGRFGYHDDSFCYSTIDGAENGGTQQSWFFVPRLQQQDDEINAWRSQMIGGETYPELQPQVFLDNYNSRTEFHQDFLACTKAIHATYMVHHDAFQNGGYTGLELSSALQAHDTLGYAFLITAVSLRESSNATVDVTVTMMQIGVAPFYYDLSLIMSSSVLLDDTFRIDGVEQDLIARNDAKEYIFVGVPARALVEIEFHLDSSYAYPGRPIRFSQGVNGRAQYKLPGPSTSSEMMMFCEAKNMGTHVARRLQYQQENTTGMS